MRFVVVFQMFVCLLSVGFSAVAGAETAGPQSFKSFGKYIWGPPAHDETRAYLDEAKIPHNSQWADDEWNPQVWADARGGNALAVINGFYKAGIITDQYFEGNDVPVLQVGQSFLDLSPLEQRRVTAFVDHVFGITSTSESGMFRIVFLKKSILWGLFKDEYEVGIFSAGGLQIQ